MSETRLDRFVAWYSRHPVRNFWLSLLIGLVTGLALSYWTGA